MRGIWKVMAVGVLTALGADLPRPALAQTGDCKAEEVFAVVDRTGQRLREIHGESQPRLRARLQEMGRKNGWAEAEIESKGHAALEDDVIRGLDQRAAQLLADLDRLADVEAGGASVCQRLDEARTKSSQLVEVTQQRSTHALARIDVAMKSPVAAAQPVQPAPALAPAPAPSAPPPQQSAAVEPQVRPTAAPPRPKAAPPAAAPAWDTRTVVRDAEPSMPPPEFVPMPPSAEAASYSPEEIRAAGRGFFGTISAGLASVIDHAFQRYGRPTGYVLGDEGGGAFFAGLRFGQGNLVTKAQGERRVYWQGPSAGFDFGVAGSQVMFLVYSVEDHEQMFQRFTGLDGSAYLVGGVGITFLKRGKVILAPIRTGLGLRVGASLGYLKFTPTPSLNPF